MVLVGEEEAAILAAVMHREAADTVEAIGAEGEEGTLHTRNLSATHVDAMRCPLILCYFSFVRNRRCWQGTQILSWVFDGECMIEGRTSGL